VSSAPSVIEAAKPSAFRPWTRVSPRILVPLLLLGVLALGAIFVPLLYGYDPLHTDLLMRLKPPGTIGPNGMMAVFGTDEVGSDLFAEMMAGTRVSLIVGICTLVIAGGVGSLLGLVAGYYGDWFDTVLMRIADIQLAFPSILLAILLVSVLGQGILNVIIVLSIANWVIFARVVRSQVLTLKNREYVQAARTLGAGDLHIIFRTILPGCIAPMLVIASVEFGYVVLAEASLSFLGVGAPFGTPSLGSTISTGTQYLATAWWISTIPGLLLLVLVLATGVLGDALRDHFDPSLRSAR
jgi:peptide/nickel transport system permease protein